PIQATFYVWAPVPKGYTSAEFCTKLLEECGVIVVPGNGYGSEGEGYFRLALTESEARISEVLGRLKEKNIQYK
ncbi:MAG: aminotransferase class I/II-fold pyridoxal phosphate-dependent enzyme, partial [Candidatus Margulisiibacteriota bacterium]